MPEESDLSPTMLTLADSASVTEAWLKAVRALKLQKGQSCYNLMYSITVPGVMTEGDIQTYERFDRFARRAEIGSATTVANTIFPLDTYLRTEANGFYEAYQEDIYPYIKTGWGTYFDRMMRRRDVKGQLVIRDGVPLNPLAQLIAKLQRRAASRRGSKTHYELTIDDEAFNLTTYLPERDSGYHIGGPCLSHISFKLDEDGALRILALYRSHYYLERALGNLLGLARLQAFVASQAQVPIGPLTCLAAHARLETGLPTANSAEVASFLQECGA